MLGSGGTKEELLRVGYLQHDQIASVRDRVSIIAIHTKLLLRYRQVYINITVYIL